MCSQKPDVRALSVRRCMQHMYATHSGLQVCPMEPEWVQYILPKLWDIDVKRLSGGATTEIAVEEAEQAAHAPEGTLKKGGYVVLPRKNDVSSVDAARARYLARKGSRPVK